MAQISESHEFLDKSGKAGLVVRSSGISFISPTQRQFEGKLSPLGLILGSGSGGKALTLKELENLGGTLTFLQIGGPGTTAVFLVIDSKDNTVLKFNSDLAQLTVGGVSNPGNIKLVNQNDKVTIHLDGQAGDIELIGADCAEEFEIVNDVDTPAGTVMVISDAQRLTPCSMAYDRKVAGVISGAGGIQPGLILGKKHSDKIAVAVALTGTVCCLVDATCGAIVEGDLLTTSATPGHAMKATDRERSFGCVLGKALGSRASGRGLVPILVALQ